MLLTESIDTEEAGYGHWPVVCKRLKFNCCAMHGATNNTLLKTYSLLHTDTEIKARVNHDAWQGWIRHLTSPEHSKCQSEGCPRIGDAHPVVLIIPGYARRKQISNLITLASTQMEIHSGSRTLEAPRGNRYAPARHLCWRISPACSWWWWCNVTYVASRNHKIKIVSSLYFHFVVTCGHYRPKLI